MTVFIVIIRIEDKKSEEWTILFQWPCSKKVIYAKGQFNF